MANFIVRMFTPSDSDQSGMVGSQAAKAQAKRREVEQSGVAKAKTVTRIGGLKGKEKDEAKTAKKTLLGG